MGCCNKAPAPMQSLDTMDILKGALKGPAANIDVARGPTLAPYLVKPSSGSLPGSSYGMPIPTEAFVGAPRYGLDSGNLARNHEYDGAIQQAYKGWARRAQASASHHYAGLE
tara:strand:+ start:259 stop:594 length:336 start_codon:yes stop_codon:yes gene_type:complete